jgi:hypothetical protein
MIKGIPLSLYLGREVVGESQVLLFFKGSSCEILMKAIRRKYI